MKLLQPGTEIAAGFLFLKHLLQDAPPLFTIVYGFS